MVPSFGPQVSEQRNSNLNADAVKEAMDRMASEIASVKHQLGGANNPSSKGSQYQEEAKNASRQWSVRVNVGEIR